ncbi:hypothetical protein ACFYT3_13650 [Nocardia amikacinitolerans]|uniref:hypothetical protein n=1 Tax=Nocardia amikacinitolerans TaxID=756689 RepID=UPI0020A301E1|nr:hypothetical protein [Nocardia amikacinitolerans]MCP2290649.1 hypothetical protein [Nocardia amikacinitolerans]
MTANNAKYLVGNGLGDRVSIFDDGRVKVWSTTHLWTVEGRDRHNALGETVVIGVGRALSTPGPTNRQHPCDLEIPLDGFRARTIAATVGVDNGTFVQFFHDGAIAVGNDGRDIDQVFNVGREANQTRVRNGVGGSVMITFEGKYRPKSLRDCDYRVTVTEDASPPPNRLYKDEFEIR